MPPRIYVLRLEDQRLQTLQCGGVWGSSHCQKYAETFFLIDHCLLNSFVSNRLRPIALARSLVIALGCQ